MSGKSLSTLADCALTPVAYSRKMCHSDIRRRMCVCARVCVSVRERVVCYFLTVRQVLGSDSCSPIVIHSEVATLIITIMYIIS